MVLYSCLSQELNFAMLTKSSYADIGVADGHACLRLCKTAELQCSFLQLLDFLSPKKISSDTKKTSSKDVRGQDFVWYAKRHFSAKWSAANSISGQQHCYVLVLTCHFGVFLADWSRVSRKHSGERSTLQTAIWRCCVWNVTRLQGERGTMNIWYFQTFSSIRKGLQCYMYFLMVVMMLWYEALTVEFEEKIS